MRACWHHRVARSTLCCCGLLAIGACVSDQRLGNLLPTGVYLASVTRPLDGDDKRGTR